MTHALIFSHVDGAGVHFSTEKRDVMEFRALIERTYGKEELGTVIEVRVETDEDYVNVLEVVKRLEKGEFFRL